MTLTLDTRLGASTHGEYTTYEASAIITANETDVTSNQLTLEILVMRMNIWGRAEKNHHVSQEACEVSPP